MLRFIRIDEVPNGLSHGFIPILSHGTGYWLWVTSAAIMVLAVGFHLLAILFRK
jgi:hypothetical protein